MLQRYAARCASLRKILPTTNVPFRPFSRSFNALNVQQQQQATTPPPIINNIATEKITATVEKQFNKSRLTRADLPKLSAKQLDTFKTVKFTLRNLKQGYRKVFPVCNKIQGLNCREALMQLKKMSNKAGDELVEFLRGAMLNCENTHGMNADRLLVRKIHIGRGKIYKSMWYHAKGRVAMRKRSVTHVFVHLVEVPAMENERRLGRYGWTNKTWEAYERKALADLQEKQKDLKTTLQQQQQQTKNNTTATESIEAELVEKKE